MASKSSIVSDSGHRFKFHIVPEFHKGYLYNRIAEARNGLKSSTLCKSSRQSKFNSALHVVTWEG